ncbi:MAG TPA: signal peptidase I [Patescibacteria group bacterium]|nr:signal peptidase I [Patescibacteria group bacterium]
MGILKFIWTFLADSFQTLILAASIFLIIYIFLFRPFQVDGISMFPTYKDGEYVLTNIITLRMNKLQRGDVIVFQAPDAPDKDYIKRIIGLPGNTVSLHDGFVYINNEKLNESAYLASDVKSYGGAFLKDDDPVTVPADNYFVMGDNRPMSSDSRTFGFVKFEAVVGKSYFVYWPIANMRLIKNPYISTN